MTAQIIIELAAEHTGISTHEIRKHTRKREFAYARQLACYALRKLYQEKWQSIAFLLGYGQHDLAIYNYKVIESQLSTKHQNQDINAFMEKINIKQAEIDKLEKQPAMLLIYFSSEQMNRMRINEISKQLNSIDKCKLFYFVHEQDERTGTFEPQSALIDITEDVSKAEFESIIGKVKEQELVTDINLYWK